ncbi:MAG: electron transfer flavoprotein subunit alpha/FixB family protein [Actinobacteria bacterium]|nr:electron transfer flavoprotein subunit alpha/FixB family protein [Actinomycetota bacterium]
MIAVVVVRDGQLPSGGDEVVAECSGRAVLIGSGTAAAAADLAGVATEITVLEVGGFQPADWATKLAPLLHHEPAVVLPGSPDGRDLAPRLAALLHRPLYAGAISVTPHRVELTRRSSTEIHQTHPGPEFVATMQPGVRGVAISADLTAPVVTDATPTHLPRQQVRDARVTEVLPPDPATLARAEAPRIIGGGAGLDGEHRMDQLAAVGAVIGASMGATRVITDRGWVPHQRQIGTTGVVVDPELYLAFGVSGAVQHTSGLGAPQHIISVNTDGHCPMMQLADLAIVADANETLDHLAALLGASLQATLHDTTEPSA